MHGFVLICNALSVVVLRFFLFSVSLFVPEMVLVVVVAGTNRKLRDGERGEWT